MNETSTKLLIFSAGCLTGATIAYSILKTRFEAKAEELDKSNKTLKNEVEVLGQDLQELSEGIDRCVRGTPLKGFSDTFKVPEANEDEQKEQPVTMADAAKEAAQFFAALNDVFQPEKDEEELTIYPITADEYGEQGYDEEQLYFYAADETLTDKDDCIVDPDETNVGDDAIDIFLYTDTENTYIRNNETKTDYEIIKVNGSYASVDSEGLYE